MSWSAAQYTKFEDERTRPVRDLLAAIPTEAVKRAIDLGCGPGNSTEALIARFPGAAVTGLDSSEDMLKAARARLPQHNFVLGDIGALTHVGIHDVVFTNASLQWVPDHARLLPELMSHVAAKGSLAVQMPDNLQEPAHLLMAEVARAASFAVKLSAAETAREARRSPDWYYRLLKHHAARVDIWRTIYHHPLQGGPRAIVEWFKSTGLRPYLGPLDADEQAAFLTAYERAIAQAYPTLEDGSVLLPFPRFFFVATKA
jgi:trans-aconitate 2-methyltransferase